MAVQGVRNDHDVERHHVHLLFSSGSRHRTVLTKFFSAACLKGFKYLHLVQNLPRNVPAPSLPGASLKVDGRSGSCSCTVSHWHFVLIIAQLYWWRLH